MDLQAAESENQRDPRDQISYTKKIWNCPCNGCKKAVKQERERIKSLVKEIDLSKLNGLGFKILLFQILDEKNGMA